MVEYICKKSNNKLTYYKKNKNGNDKAITKKEFFKFIGGGNVMDMPSFENFILSKPNIDNMNVSVLNRYNEYKTGIPQKRKLEGEISSLNNMYFTMIDIYNNDNNAQITINKVDIQVVDYLRRRT